jgi:hypothetical protein
VQGIKNIKMINAQQAKNYPSLQEHQRKKDDFKIMQQYTSIKGADSKT